MMLNIIPPRRGQSTGRGTVSPCPEYSARRAHRNRCASVCSAIWAARIAMSVAPATASPSNWRSRISVVRYSAGRSRCCRAMIRTSRTWPSSLAREWIDNQGVDVLADGAASSSGLAIQQVCREKKRIYLITGPATSDMTGKQCSPYGIHFAYDTYALAHGTGSCADQGRRRYAGSSSPPTMHSAMRWSATRSPRCRRPAARFSAA